MYHDSGRFVATCTCQEEHKYPNINFTDFSTKRLHDNLSKIKLSKMSRCPDLYPYPSGQWLKMWTYRLVFYGINLKIFEVTTLSTKHIFDEMSCIVTKTALEYHCNEGVNLNSTFLGDLTVLA